MDFITWIDSKYLNKRSKSDVARNGNDQINLEGQAYDKCSDILGEIDVVHELLRAAASIGTRDSKATKTDQCNSSIGLADFRLHGIDLTKI